MQIHSYQGLMDGLVVHFDKALPSILLYRQERGQVSIMPTYICIHFFANYLLHSLCFF